MKGPLQKAKESLQKIKNTESNLADVVRLKSDSDLKLGELKEPLKKMRDVESELMDVMESRINLNLKSDELKGEKSLLEDKIHGHSLKYKELLILNVSGKLSDTELEKICLKNDDLSRQLERVNHKFDAIEMAMKNNKAAEGSLINKRNATRIQFLKAAFADLKKGLDQEFKELFYELWAIYRHYGSNYDSFMGEILPKEGLHESDARWNRFVARYKIEH